MLLIVIISGVVRCISYVQSIVCTPSWSWFMCELVVGAEQIKSLNFNTYSYIQDVVDLLYSRGFQYFPITYKKMFRGY